MKTTFIQTIDKFLYLNSKAIVHVGKHIFNSRVRINILKLLLFCVYNNYHCLVVFFNINAENFAKTFKSLGSQYYNFLILISKMAFNKTSFKVRNFTFLSEVLSHTIKDNEKKITKRYHDFNVKVKIIQHEYETKTKHTFDKPGKNEDVTGLPFVGAAGKFLNEMLAGAEMVRSDVYITNIVKYRPPNNRDPLPDEKEAFWPYLVRQLDVIRPQIVVTLGRHSMEYFLPGKKISMIHGQPKRIQFGDTKITVVPLYHPAAALYNGSMRATLIEDFNKLSKIIDIQKQEKENI